VHRPIELERLLPRRPGRAGRKSAARALTLTAGVVGAVGLGWVAAWWVLGGISATCLVGYVLLVAWASSEEGGSWESAVR